MEGAVRCAGLRWAELSRCRTGTRVQVHLLLFILYHVLDWHGAKSVCGCVRWMVSSTPNCG